MKRRLYYLLFSLLIGSFSLLMAQNPRATYRKGIKAEKKGDFAESENLFREVLRTDSTFSFASFALSNSLYQQGKFKEALEQYARINLEKGDLSQEQAATLFHNMGNAEMKQKQYPQAAEYYKQSLRLNPLDDETRYNLTLALKLMEQNNQQSPQSNNSPQPQPQPQPQKSQDQSKEKTQNSQQIDPKTSKQILDSYRQDDDEARKKYEQQKRTKEDSSTDKDKKRW